jgi:hypothetical protein
VSTNDLTIENVRENIVGIDTQVPLLNGSHHTYVNLDNAASTPALRPVADKLNEFLNWYSSVHRGTGFKSQVATHIYDESHEMSGYFTLQIVPFAAWLHCNRQEVLPNSHRSRSEFRKPSVFISRITASMAARNCALVRSVTTA